MINAAEEIVNLWLQDCENNFTMQNTSVPKKMRKVGGRKIYGGVGKEIDLISTDGKKFYWIEISVSPSPYLIKGENPADAAIGKFAKEKEQYLKYRFGNKLFHKRFIYSPKMFSKKSGGENKFCDALKKKGIEAISFGRILNELSGYIKFMGFGLTRNYLFLLKRFEWGNL